MSGGANLVQWFEIPVSDLARATAFYEKVLGVSFTPLEQHGLRMAWFPTVDGGEGSGGALVQGEGRTPAGRAPSCTSPSRTPWKPGSAGA